MVNEALITRECAAKTFARARSVARNGQAVYNRKCDYELGSICLRACVESSSWSDWPYDVSVTLSEDEQRILDYECTCPAHSRYPGMCKHAAGLLLIYNQEPESFKGYEFNAKTRTSASVSALIKRMSQRKAQATHVQADAAGEGAINLLPKMEPDYDDRWLLSFKIASPAANYVVKSIKDLLEDVDAERYHEYGKKLGFTHSLTSFTAQAQSVINWLMRVTASRDGWWGNSGYQYSSNLRYLRLTESQAIELFDLYLGSTVDIPVNTASKSMDRAIPVVDGNPPLQLEIEAVAGGYVIDRFSDYFFLCFQKRVYAMHTHGIYRCTPEYAEVADFLLNVHERGEQHLIVSEDDMPSFCSSVLPVLEKAFSVQAPPELENLKPVACKVEFYLDTDGSRATCEAKALYGKDSYPLWNLEQPSDKPKRDIAQEQASRDAVTRYLPQALSESTVATESDDDLARLLFYGADELKRYGDVFCTDAFLGKRSKRSASVSAGVRVKSKLINMSVSADELSPEEIAGLLESYSAKKRYHKLKDGTFLDLEQQSAEDLKRLEAINALAAELGVNVKELLNDGVDLDSYHAFLLDEVIEDEEKDASFKEFIRSFDADARQDHEVPKSLTKTLRPYQVEGYKWLRLLSDTGLGGILADEMGLGKSLQIITLLVSCVKELDEQPALIVCPASLVYNWKAEFRKFAPDIEVCVLSGLKVERDRLREQGGYQAFVTSYDTLRQDIDDFDAMSFSFLIIDEAQYIKNHKTKAARAVKAINADHRIALTGTPIENRLSELWSIFDFLMPGLLGPYSRFKERYEAPIVNGDEICAARLSAKVGPFIMRRLKQDVLKDLPDKLETVVHTKLVGKQRELYDAHETRLRQSLIAGSEKELAQGKIAVLAELMKLRQLCCDPRLLFSDYTNESAKLDALSELVQAAIDGGEKVLVFSQFTSYLDLIAAELDKHGWEHFSITGATPKKQRMELVETFNGDDTPVFLISLKAGGTGLNLVGASVVIHADPWWNAAAQSQATDRAHRIGQTREVSVYKIIADDTIEERILELQESKVDLANAVLNAEGASLGSLSKDELIDLLTRA